MGDWFTDRCLLKSVLRQVVVQIAVVQHVNCNITFPERKWNACTHTVWVCLWSVKRMCDYLVTQQPLHGSNRPAMFCVCSLISKCVRIWMDLSSAKIANLRRACWSIDDKISETPHTPMLGVCCKRDLSVMEPWKRRVGLWSSMLPIWDERANVEMIIKVRVHVQRVCMCVYV